MKLENYRVYLIEVGLRFETKQTKKEIDSIFRKLVDISEFDGIKKISTEDKETIAKLTTSDNNLKLYVTNEDISITFTNSDLLKDVSSGYNAIKDVVKNVRSYIKDTAVDAVRSRHVNYSTNPSDLAYLKSELLNEKYLNDLDSMDIWLEYPDENIGGLDTMLSVSVTNEHTNGIHAAFKAKKKTSLLKNMSVVTTSVGLLVDVDASNINTFIDYCISDMPTKISLDKLGYGTEQ